MKALEGITILDLTHMLAGPYGTMLLADMGARTIKIEPPEKGEGTRRLLEHSPEYSRDGMGAYFLTLCRNKESVAIDLKSPEGLELFYGLVRQADVVFSNFGAGVTERLKIDFAHLSAINPRIVTCSVTGFGETGPAPNRPAFDLVAQGMGGGMDAYRRGRRRAVACRHPDRRSGRRAVRCAGRSRGPAGATAHRPRPARRHLDVRLSALAAELHGDHVPDVGQLTRPRRERPFRARAYNTFRTKTRYLILAVITDNFWVSLVDLLGDDALRREDFKKQPGRFANKAFIEQRVQAALEKENCEYWLEVLERARIPAAR